MTVRQLLEKTGWTVEELASRLDVKPATVKRARPEPVPPSWYERLGLEPVDEWEDVTGRAHEQDPKAPADARIVEPPPLEGVDFGALAGYIEGAYKLGAYAVRPSDLALAGAIEGHAKAAGEAWAKWVESEPKVAALLQRMMVGTPLGEVIAVHVSLGFAYFLARSAEQKARAEARAREAEHVAGNGADGPGFVEEPLLI